MLADVRCGSKALFSARQKHVRFAPGSDPHSDMIDFGFVPLATKDAAATDRLFDHFVGADKQCRGHCKAERFCRLEVNYQLEFCRSLCGKIGRTAAA